MNLPVQHWRFVPAMLLAACVLAVPADLAAQDGSVSVAVARANVRAEPSEKSGVLLQVPAGTVLALKAVEGDWFKVELPPDPRLNGLRVQGYLSRKVAKVLSPVATPPSPGSPGPPPHVRAGMSVALQTGKTTTWLTPEVASVRAVDAAVGSLRALVGIMPMHDAPPAGQGAAPVTFVWVLAGGTAPRVLEAKRPAFLAMFKDTGFAPGSIAPVLVRLTPAPSGIRLVAAARGRADQATRPETDWEVMRDLRQDPARAVIEIAEPGAARVTPAEDLDLGEYALVFRPTSRTKVSGPSVLSSEDSVFKAVWAFSVR